MIFELDQAQDASQRHLVAGERRRTCSTSSTSRASGPSRTRRSSAGTTTRSTRQRVRNYTAKPIDLEIRRTLPGHVVFRSQLEPKLHDYQTVEYTATVPAGKRVDLLHEIVRHQGRNAKQNNVTLEAGEVRP